jgi:two-component system sensor histidine kinase KdpD
MNLEKELSNHKVTTVIPPHLPLVLMDFILMQHALTNLLANAVLHTPPGTPVEVSAGIENGGLDITVADQGPGIPPASLEHLFNKFYRAPNAPNGGTGLGLSLVKGFLESQGGIASVENRTEGGAKFTLHLPLKQNNA